MWILPPRLFQLLLLHLLHNYPDIVQKYPESKRVICTLYLQVEEGAFVKESFDELCWTLTAKKNYKANRNGNSVISHEDAFKLWCLFNFLSEDKYPLVMVPDEVGSLQINFLHCICDKG